MLSSCTSNTRHVRNNSKLELFQVLAGSGGRPHLFQVVLRRLQERVSGLEPALTLRRVQAQTLLLEPGAHLVFTPA